MDAIEPATEPSTEEPRRTRPKMIKAQADSTPAHEGGDAAAPLALAQTVEDLARGEAVGDLPDRGLIAADGQAGRRADQPIGRADGKSALRQELLQLIELL